MKLYGALKEINNCNTNFSLLLTGAEYSLAKKYYILRNMKILQSSKLVGYNKISNKKEDPRNIDPGIIDFKNLKPYKSRCLSPENRQQMKIFPVAVPEDCKPL